MSYFGDFDTESVGPEGFFDDDIELGDSGSIAAARLYFPLSTAADVSPSFSGAWTDTGSALRRKLAVTKGASAITAGSTIALSSASAFALDRQYVSQPMKAQTIVGSTTVKMQLMVREHDLADNVDYVITNVRVFSNDGSTEKANLLNLAGYGTVGTEFINNATCRNSICNNGTWDISSNGDYGGGDYVVNEGDRLVVDIGYGCNSGTGTTPEASAKWGEDATDLPEDDSQTSDGAGWIEFSQSILFQSASGTTHTGAAAYAISLTKAATPELRLGTSANYTISVTKAATPAALLSAGASYAINLTTGVSPAITAAGLATFAINLTNDVVGGIQHSASASYTISLTESAAGSLAVGGSVGYLIALSKSASGSLAVGSSAEFVISVLSAAAGFVPTISDRPSVYSMGSGQFFQAVQASGVVTKHSAPNVVVTTVGGSLQITRVVRASSH